MADFHLMGCGFKDMNLGAFSKIHHLTTKDTRDFHKGAQSKSVNLWQKNVMFEFFIILEP